MRVPSMLRWALQDHGAPGTRLMSRLPPLPVTPRPKTAFPSVFLTLQPPATLPHPEPRNPRAIVKTGRSVRS